MTDNILEKIKNKSPNTSTSQDFTPGNGLISQTLIDLFNYRIKMERESAYIYKAMSLWLEDKSYFNGAKLWDKFYHEELIHAEWSEEFLLSLNIRPVTPDLNKPQNDFKDYGEIVEQTLKHEIVVTKQCQELASACQKENNILGYTLAHKYVAEQIEELKKANDLKTLLDTYGREKLNLALFDHELERFLD